MGYIWSALLHVRVFHVEIKHLGFFWQRAKYMYTTSPHRSLNRLHKNRWTAANITHKNSAPTTTPQSQRSKLLRAGGGYVL